MSTTLAKWMTLFIAVTIMFTPILAYLDGLHREAVDMVLYQGMKDASVEGQLTPIIMDEMRNQLITQYNFDPDSIIDISGTTGVVPRGAFIEGEITVKRTPLFVVNIFNQGSATYKRPFTIMSEYIQ